MIRMMTATQDQNVTHNIIDFRVVIHPLPGVSGPAECVFYPSTALPDGCLFVTDTGLPGVKCA